MSPNGLSIAKQLDVKSGSLYPGFAGFEKWITISGLRWLRQFPFSLVLLPPLTKPNFLFMQESIERTTPTTRLNYDLSSLSPAEKDKIRKADPNGGVCLITNKPFSLNFCHCIPKRIAQNEKIVCV